MSDAPARAPASNEGRSHADRVSSEVVLLGALAYVVSWSRRHWLAAAAVAAGVLLVTGIPTDLIPTPLFRRPIAATWWDYPIWALTAALAGLIAATYVGPRARESRASRPKLAYGGGLLSFFAVGCPTCNKVAVVALGVGGASTTFAALQPILGLAALALLAAALVVRLRAAAACRVDLRPGGGAVAAGRAGPGHAPVTRG